MELREALVQIAEIRHQMARSEVSRGFRALPVAFSGGLAVACALVQKAVAPEPRVQIGPYLTLWIGAAVVNALAAGAGMLASRPASSAWARQATRLAVEQFAPALIAGGLVTAVLAARVPEALPLLPGLWQVLFGVGIFAACRHLPRATRYVGAFYLLSGLACLAWAREEWALSPWAMGLPFGCGQTLAAAILYWTLERSDGQD